MIGYDPAEKIGPPRRKTAGRPEAGERHGMKHGKHPALRNIAEGIRGEVHWNEPLSRHTSLKIGGPADLLVLPATVEELQLLLRRANEEGVPVFVLGGTNLLVRDGGIRGIVIKLTRFQEIEPKGSAGFRAGAGLPMPKAARYAQDAGLAGLEFAIGIPGTVGGAVVMNAGVRDAAVADVLEGIRIVSWKGEIRDVARDEMDFGYRWSRIPGGVIVSADFGLRRDDREKIVDRMQRFLRHRRDTQPLRQPSAGSVFKNPNGIFAAQVIESLGFKGMQVGDAQVSPRHANFIVNRGRATAADVIRLIRTIGKKAEEAAGITLELELKIVGADD